MSATLLRASEVEKFYGTLIPVSVISTANLDLDGLEDINGATGVAGDRVLVTGQTTPAEDGIYLMNAAAWERADDADITNAAGQIDVGGMLARVEKGTDAGKFYVITNSRGAGVVGVDQLAVQAAFDPNQTMATRVFGEEATFVPNEFTAEIANAATASTLRVYRNGSRMLEGAGNDYTFAGTTITFSRKLRNNNTVVVDYEY